MSTLAASKTVRKNDIGVIFTATFFEPDPDNPDTFIVKDISTATIKELIFQKPNPDLTVDVRTADFVTNGEDGQVQYTSLGGDLDVAGRWSLEGEVTLPTGTFRSDRARFDVEEILE